LNISIRSEAQTGRYAVTGGFIIAGGSESHRAAAQAM